MKKVDQKHNTKDVETLIANDPKLQEIKHSFQKEVQALKKIGLDVKTHWQTLQNSI